MNYFGSQAWIIATIGSSISWAISDLACDICIEEQDGEDEDEEFELEALVQDKQQKQATFQKPNEKVDIEMTNTSKNEFESESSNGYTFRRSLSSESRLTQRNGDVSPRVSLDRDNGLNMDIESRSEVSDDDEEAHMCGEQDCAVSGMVTLVMLYSILINNWANTSKLSEEGPFQKVDSMKSPWIWVPFVDTEWYLASIGGVCMFAHYLLLLWAYDNAPSTVINPLLQVSSTWVLLGSAVPAAIMGLTFITPFDLSCYFVIIIGGIIPSINGNLKLMLRREFWQQGFVRYTILSEGAVGLYDLLLSYVLRSTAASMETTEISDADPSRLENEYFIIAWGWFTISFICAYSIHPRLRNEFRGLARLPRKIVLLAVSKGGDVQVGCSLGVGFISGVGFECCRVWILLESDGVDGFISGVGFKCCRVRMLLEFAAVGFG